MVEVISPRDIWEAALRHLQTEVNTSNYQTWLKGTTGLSYRENDFFIGVPNTFVAEYLDKNQRSLIEKVLAYLAGSEVRVQFQVQESPADMSARTGSRGKTVSPQQARLPLLNPKYTFDTFVVGQGNQLAHAAALGVARHPGRSYNPLFIHAGPGLGKTHLLQAIGQLAQDHDTKVLYVSAEQYTNELVSSIREKKTEEFRSKCRSADMLLVDDIQFLSGKEKTAEHFFYTFNDLHNANCQIAVTGDHPPRDLPLLPERLRSRLEWGLVADIQPPDFDTRLAILRAKAEERGIRLPQDVLETIALQVRESIRSLEGSLNRLIAYAKLMRTALTAELAKQALKDMTGNEVKALPITPAIVIEAVVNTFQISPAELKSRKKDEATVLARQVAMYLIRQETDSSLAEVGRALGGRSPATVSHAYQKIASDLDTCAPLQRKVFEIQQKIYSATRNGGTPEPARS